MVKAKCVQSAVQCGYYISHLAEQFVNEMTHCNV